ncbi:DUF927 domain-containing protein [Paraburkholderia sp. MM5384-R2]|uniref:DUF927 domain-containing protein n=1 Tax=Paraburkholderia sp. MM5384-R2 TaxID=2723097 RepID=UPI001610EE13|nr:DUF927 domain-containing protein [Paraburkholderia sp. MM5384-R2]MBB5501556.1 putative DNA primase/helicase [Paraburkholderia sp. MM5384-R2]
MSAIIDEQQRIEAALAVIPPGIEREQWWRIAAAIKHECGDAGFDIFDAWSRGAECYEATDARDTWKSLRADGGIRIGTLYGIASHYGFEPAAHAGPVVDAAVLEQRRAQRKAQAVRSEANTLTRQREAATLAIAIWSAAGPSRDDHPYLVRKGLNATPMLREIDAPRLHALLGYRPKQSGEELSGRILIARIERDGQVTSLEMIDVDGRKSALANGVKSGGCWLASAPTGRQQRIAIAEGIGSAQTHQQAYPDDLAVAALSAGNLSKVAQAMRAAHPEAAILLLGEIGNGADKAVEAARAVGGALAVPDFGEERPEGATDINDLLTLRGVEAVRACVGAAAMPEPTTFPGMDERPCWSVCRSELEIDGKRIKPGVYYHGVKPGKGDERPTLVNQWISTPLYVRAITRNPQDGDYGRLLEYVSPSGRWKKWSMPMSMLAGDGGEARGVLLSEGVMFDLKNRGGVLGYIAGQHPEQTMRAATVTGWCAEAFVLPDEVIGADDIWFQSMGRTAPYGIAGTFEAWKSGVAALAKGNPLLMLAISAGLAGPLLALLNMEGAGLHFYSDSSTGKSTSLYASLSAWGSPAYKRTWRSTSNGLEAAGSLHTDTLLALDEIGEIKPHDLHDTCPQVAGEMGNGRSDSGGS